MGNGECSVTLEAMGQTMKHFKVINSIHHHETFDLTASKIKFVSCFLVGRSPVGRRLARGQAHLREGHRTQRIAQEQDQVGDQDCLRHQK